MSVPVEKKVQAATIAAAALSVAFLVLDAVAADTTLMSLLPPWAQSLLVVAGTLAAGYQAKHTPRPDLHES